MAKLWLPIKHAPIQRLVPKMVRDPVTGREMLLFLPLSEDTESRSHEQELWQAAEERAIEEMRAKGKKPVSKLSRKEVGRILNEYKKYLTEKQQRSGVPKYTPGTSGLL